VSVAETKPLTSLIDVARGPLALKGYEAAGGYAALRTSIKQLTPQDVQGRVKDASLRGRGGAGFPTGIKWSLVPMGGDAPKQKYVVCNADEGDSGTFADRTLMEGDPLTLIEGMTIAAVAVGAIEALGHVEERDQLQSSSLVAALDSSDKRVRYAAAVALAKASGGVAVPANDKVVEVYLGR